MGSDWNVAGLVNYSNLHLHLASWTAAEAEDGEEFLPFQITFEESAKDGVRMSKHGSVATSARPVDWEKRHWRDKTWPIISPLAKSGCRHVSLQAHEAVHVPGVKAGRVSGTVKHTESTQ